jgi:hypothetical protein
MSADAVAETTLSKAPAPRRRAWVYALIVVLVVISFGYLNLINSKESFVNNDFYRVLYEASNKFNENLNQLDKMHKNKESISSIRTQLPSYKLTNNVEDKRTNNVEGEHPITGSFEYLLAGQKIEIKSETLGAELRITDILPSPKKGFSQYLFANSKGKVLATISNEKTISIDNLSSINKEIEDQKRRYRFNLKESKSSDGENYEQHLPSYSSHVDMKLSYGEFRVFIFPFSLDTALITKHKNQEPDNSGNASADDTINTLYLVGLLPKHKLHTEGPGHWNLSLLLVTLVSLLFIWTLLRLYLLPKDQSITSLFRNFTMLASYGFFIVLIALVLAFMQKTTLQASKDRAAAAYAQVLSAQLNGDLLNVFNGLAGYRPFYHNLLAELDNFAAVNESNGTESKNNSPATDSFSQMVKKSLASITTTSCESPHKAMLPGYAFTPLKVYPITFNNCLVDAHGRGNWQVALELDQSAEGVLLKAHKNNGEDVLNFMAGNLDIKMELKGPKGMVESYISPGEDSYLPNNIYSVLAINEEGKSTLPTIYYQESNAPPQVLNLAHRDYYKNVRDYQGWRLCRTAEEKKNDQCAFNNIYIQRLLNINDGTRGTTISMPMYDSKDSVIPADGLTAYTLVADVILPSLSLAAPAPYDFTYMVIDRNSGDVLFHSDESRTLVENLFYSGNIKSNLSQWVKAGLDHYPELSEKKIKGHYHGQPGRFVLIPAPIDAWAIVIFYPNDSLDTLMTNQFFLISVSFAIALLGLVGLLFFCCKFFRTNVLKNKLSIPAKINGRVIIMVGSMILSVIYSLYYIGILFDRAEVGPQSASSFSLVLPSAGVLILLLCLFRIYKNYFSVADSNSHVKGLKPFFAVTILLLLFHLYYLHHVAQMPIKALGFHYQQVHCKWHNYENQEEIKMALSRYPNSITQQRIDPKTLLPSAPNLAKNLKDKNACEMHSSQVEPDDYINLSSLMGVNYLWQWIKTYLLATDLPTTLPLAIQKKDLDIALWPVVGNSILILAIILAWLVFNRRILWMRLYCSDRFLQHIERLTKSESTLEQDQHNTKLIIECDRVKLNGIGLALLLRTAVMHENKSAEFKLNNLLAGFDTLYQLSPYLQKLGANNSFLPNLKLNVEENSDSKKLDVQIWDIETCLAQVEFRQHLLDLIMEIKSLTLANQLNSFTIFTGYRSFQRVKMKDPLSIEKGSILEHTEYLSWAECLMDFNVKVTEVFERGLDKQLLKQEIADFPELFFLSPDTLDTSEAAEKNLWNKREDPNIESQWATINYILLRADAIYRFKWESCSNAEKLALLNLDKQHRLNPSNTQMIEHLAANGLVKVKQGHLEIINSSFAHFIRNAETTDTVNRLVSQSEAGLWKDYQLPLGLLVILIIGGIALTSGESIYIIAASVAGVIGTIASVTSSARILRGQFKG